MRKLSIKYFLTIIAFTMGISTMAANWDQLVDLEGTWYFTVGDDANWAEVDVDMSRWDKIHVPDNWEKYYKEYNGYGWYRKSFEMRWIPKEGQVVLFLGQIDDVDEVFVNGVKVGQSGSFFPDYQSAYSHNRQYYLPKDLIRKGKNSIAVRVYDEGGGGGMVSGRDIGIYYDTDYTLLSQDLSGLWKFSTHRNGDVFSESYDDSDWDEIQVPGHWESQGYENHDGLAWYRTQFTVPQKLKEENLYLVLGKIDDTDRVFLNGEPFARTEYLDGYSKYNKWNAYNLYRVYRLPSNKIKHVNTLVVEVKDTGIGGGIYEGPVGIMTGRDAGIILERNDEDFFNNPIEYIIRSIFE